MPVQAPKLANRPERAEFSKLRSSKISVCGRGGSLRAGPDRSPSIPRGKDSDHGKRTGPTQSSLPHVLMATLTNLYDGPPNQAHVQALRLSGNDGRGAAAAVRPTKHPPRQSDPQENIFPPTRNAHPARGGMPTQE